MKAANIMKIIAAIAAAGAMLLGPLWLKFEPMVDEKIKVHAEQSKELWRESQKPMLESLERIEVDLAAIEEEVRANGDRLITLEVKSENQN